MHVNGRVINKSGTSSYVTSVPCHSSLLGKRAPLLMHAKKPKQHEEETSTSYREDSDESSFSFQFKETRVSLSKQNAAISGLVLLGLSALIGPLIFGIIFGSISIILASLGGALALSTIFLPVLIFSIFFVLIPFGGAAFFGLSLVAPTFLQLFLSGSALALGWWAMNKLLVQPSTPAEPSPTGKRAVMKGQAEVVLKVKSDEEIEIERVQRELKDFDALLRERQRRKS